MHLVMIVFLGLSLLSRAPCAAAAAEQVGVPEPDQEDLAREFNDPLTTLPQIFLQDAYTPSNFGTEAPSNRVTLRPIIPRIPRFSLLPVVQLVRPSFSVVTVPIGKGHGTRTEFGDMQLFDLALLPWPNRDSGLLMGIGPTFVFPTATHESAGQGAWQVGPALGAIYRGVPGLLLGCLIQNPISFAYTSGDRPALSTLIFQPIALKQVWRGLYVKSADSSWAIGWHEGAPKLVPLGLGVGYVIVDEGHPSINLSLSGEWMAYRENARFAPQTTVRFGVSVAFPKLRPW